MPLCKKASAKTQCLSLAYGLRENVYLRLTTCETLHVETKGASYGKEGNLQIIFAGGPRIKTQTGTKKGGGGKKPQMLFLQMDGESSF